MPASSTPAVSEFVRHLVAEWFREHDYHGARGELAKLLGVSGAHVTNIRSHGRGVGERVKRRIAELYFEGSIDRLDAAAEEWWRNQDTSDVKPGPRVEYPERYPNRADAAAFARKGGVSEEAIRTVLGWELQADDDPNPLQWLEWMQAKDRELKYAAKGPVKPPVELTDDD